MKTSTFIIGAAAIAVAATATGAGLDSSPTHLGPVPVEGQEIPLHETFDTDSLGLNGFTVLDANADSTTWKWNSTLFNMKRGGTACYWYHDNLEADDWLLSPEISLQADGDYLLNCRLAGADTYDPKQFLEIWVGQGDDPAAYTKLDYEIEPEADIFFQDALTKISVEHAGDYRVAFRAISSYTSTTGGSWLFMQIDKLDLTQNSKYAAPAPVEDLAIVTDKADTNIKIRCTAPAKTYDGKELTQLKAINFYHTIPFTYGGTVEGEREFLVGTIENPEPGAELVYEAQEAEGMAKYRVEAVNDAGASTSVNAQGWVGMDTPDAPQGVEFYDNDEGGFTMTWDRVTSGVHGGYVDADQVKYIIVDKDDVMVDKTDGNDVWNFTPESLEGPRQFYQYGVKATCGELTGEPTLAYPVVTGDAQTLPFRESFAGNVMEHPDLIWCVSNIPYYGFGDGMGLSVDSDGGSSMAYGNNYNKDDIGTVCSLNSPKISLAGAKNPMLSFYYYGAGDPAAPTTLEVEVCDNGRENTVLLHEEFDNQDQAYLTSYDAAAAAGYWRRAQFPLTDFAQSDYIVLHFKGTIMSLTQGEIHLDQIYVRDMPEHNLRAEMEASPKVFVGEDGVVTLTVKNTGVNATDQPFNITVTRNGEPFQAIQEERSLGSDQEFTYSLPFTPTALEDSIGFEGSVDYARDLDLTDNSAAASVDVQTYGFPTATAINADDTGAGVEITWQAPDLSNQHPTDEGFEDYEPWSGSFGHWKSVDRDGERTLGSGNFGFDFPGMGDPAAFFTFNANAVYDGLAEEHPQFAAQSGEQCLASFDTNSWTSQRTYATMDWLVSPRLSGRAQTISICLHALDNPSNEVVAFYYSTTGSNPGVAGARRDPGDFTEVERVTGVPGEWTEYFFDVPEGTTYFAIQSGGMEGWATFVDDITYEGLADHVELAGFNLYRDGELIATLGADQTSYTDPRPGSLYQVTALYAAGESQPVAATNSSVGIGAVQADSNAEYFDLMGRCRKASDLTPGVYVMKQGNQTRKILVR